MPLVYLSFPNVFSDVYLYVNARIMPGEDCKTHKMGTTLTDLRKYLQISKQQPGRKCKTAKVSLSFHSKAVIYE